MIPYDAFTSSITSIAAVTNFRGSFQSVWSTVTRSIPGLTELMNIIGVILVLFSVIAYFWQHRRGSNWGGGTGPIWGALIFGGIMLAPGVLLPLLLGALDWVIDFVYNLVARPLRG